MRPDFVVTVAEWNAFEFPYVMTLSLPLCYEHGRFQPKNHRRYRWLAAGLVRAVHVPEWSDAFRRAVSDGCEALERGPLGKGGWIPILRWYESAATRSAMADIDREYTHLSCLYDVIDVLGHRLPRDRSFRGVRAVAEWAMRVRHSQAYNLVKLQELAASAPFPVRDCYAALNQNSFATPDLAAVVRDVFPTPRGEELVPPEPLRPEWLTREVDALARHVWHEHDYGVLPILADALEEAGCDRSDVLAHLRTHPHHCRGCWALQGVLYGLKA